MTSAMKDVREEWYDASKKVAVTFADVTSAAQDLARGHLCGPTSAYFLSKALAAAALLHNPDNALAVATLKASALRPAQGPVDGDPFSERAFLFSLRELSVQTGVLNSDFFFWGEDILSSHIRLKCFGDENGAVRLIVVFEQSYQAARRGDYCVV